MKNYIYIFLLTLLTCITGFSCREFNEDDKIPPVYSSLEDIIHPPDVFDVLFYLRDIGSHEAKIQFDTSHVWQIERKSSSIATLWIQRQYADSTAKLDIADEIQVGMEGNYLYSFFVNNITPVENKNFIVRFTRLPYDYETFPVKF